MISSWAFTGHKHKHFCTLSNTRFFGKFEEKNIGNLIITIGSVPYN